MLTSRVGDAGIFDYPVRVPRVFLKLISRLPFGKRTALRLYNRVVMHVWPRHRAKTYFGAEMDCDVRDMIQATLIHFGVWEPAVSNALAKRLKAGDVAVDVGANIGYYSSCSRTLALRSSRSRPILAWPGPFSTISTSMTPPTFE
jgi:hypothetical protein